MKKSIQIYSLLVLCFGAFLALSGVLSSLNMPTLSLLVGYIGYAVPIVIFIVYSRRGEERIDIPILSSREGIFLSIPFVFITLFGVMGISLLTSLLLTSFGGAEGEALSGGLFYLLTRYALVPSILEELLFRLIPLALIAPKSRKSALVISTLLFATVHADLFKIPYALFAGFIYILCDILAGSVIPSLVMHLFNNVIAILWQTHFIPHGVAHFALIVIGALAFISLLVVLIFRKRYLSYFRAMLDKGDKVGVDNLTLLTIILFSSVAIFSLF